MKHIPHLFISKEEKENKRLSEAETHHLVNVMRLKEGDSFTCADNEGFYFNCKISTINKKNLGFDILENKFFEKEKNQINLIQAITKIETFEEILDKSTQLGVSSIQPIITDFSNKGKELYQKKQERFSKILKSSSEQSQRIFMPILKEIITLDTLIDKINSDETIVCYEKSEISIKKFFSSSKNNNINIIIGSEGGFSEREAQLFLEKNYTLFSISKHILRAETAVICALSNVFYEIQN